MAGIWRSRWVGALEEGSSFRYGGSIKREKQEDKGNSGEARVAFRVQSTSKNASGMLSRDAAWAAVCRSLRVI